MKKISGVIFAVCLVLILAGCATTSGLPKEIEKARKGAPEDAIVGVGTAKMGTLNMSRTTAATRARADISNVLDSVVANMFRDFTASSEVDSDAQLAYQESFTRTLSEANISGAVIVEEKEDKDGNWWVVMYLGAADIAKVVNQAESQARLRVPQAAALDTESRMDNYLKEAKAARGY